MQTIKYKTDTSTMSVKILESAINHGSIMYLSVVGSYSSVKAILAALRMKRSMTIDRDYVQAKILDGEGGQGKGWFEHLPETGKTHAVWLTSDPSFILCRGSSNEAFKVLRDRYSLTGLDEWGAQIIQSFESKRIMDRIPSTHGIHAYFVSGDESIMDNTIAYLVKEGTLSFGGAA